MKRSTFLTALPAAGAFLLAGAQAAEPTEAQKKIIAEIEANGGSARPLAQDDDRLDVDFHLSGESVTDEKIAPVAKLEKVYRLHLGKTSLTDAGLAHIAGLASLEKLHLEQTKVTDAGLKHLAGLTNLTYLNLYGTEVSDDGIDQIKALPKLEKLYLWQTKVTDKGAAKLKAAKPNLMIDRGWDLAEVEKINETAIEPKEKEEKEKK